MGIEPTSEAWEASILPLYDARSASFASQNITAPAPRAITPRLDGLHRSLPMRFGEGSSHRSALRQSMRLPFTLLTY